MVRKFSYTKVYRICESDEIAHQIKVTFIVSIFLKNNENQNCRFLKKRKIFDVVTGY